MDNKEVDFFIVAGRVCWSISSSNPTKKSSGNALCCCSHLEDDFVLEPSLLLCSERRFGGRIKLSRDVVEENDKQEDERGRIRAVAFVDVEGRTDAPGLSSLDSQALRFVPILSGGNVVKWTEFVMVVSVVAFFFEFVMVAIFRLYIIYVTGSQKNLLNANSFSPLQVTYQVYLLILPERINRRLIFCCLLASNNVFLPKD